MSTANKYSDHDLYGIKSDAVRYTWAGYFLFVVLSSLIGDTTILVASIKYKVFKLHKAIIVLIQYIAVCDLMVTATLVIPRTISLFANGWILGDTLCYINPYVAYYLSAVGVYLVCVMTFFKLFTLQCPFRTRQLSVKKAHLTAAAAWMFSSLIALVFFIVDKDDVSFDFRSYICDYHMSSKVWNWLTPIITTIFCAIPTCLVLTASIQLLVIAKRVARRGEECLKWQGIMTIGLTAAVYCISIIPYAVYRIAEQHVTTSDDPLGFFQRHYFKIAQSFVPLNTISNFYIYCLTLTSFREFLWSRIKLLRRTPCSLGRAFKFK